MTSMVSDRFDQYGIRQSVSPTSCAWPCAMCGFPRMHGSGSAGLPCPRGYLNTSRDAHIRLPRTCRCVRAWRVREHTHRDTQTNKQTNKPKNQQTNKLTNKDTTQAHARTHSARTYAHNNRDFASADQRQHSPPFGPTSSHQPELRPHTHGQIGDNIETGR